LAIILGDRLGKGKWDVNKCFGNVNFLNYTLKPLNEIVEFYIQFAFKYEYPYLKFPIKAQPTSLPSTPFHFFMPNPYLVRSKTQLHGKSRQKALAAPKRVGIGRHGICRQ
jgi:hypothetical protein